MSRYLKQIIIALIYLLILAIIVGGIYLLVRPKLPTCSDGIQNQEEAGVDCGEPCSPCSWQLRKDLEVIFAEAIKTKDNYVDLVAKINNTNKDFGVSPFSYIFNLYDVNNNLIFSKEGGSYILPQETKYIIEQKILANSEIYNTELKIADVTWQEPINYQTPELLIRNPVFEKLTDLNRVSATLENKSNYNFDKVDVSAILFGKESKILAVGKIELRTILSKESRYFEVSWFFPIEGQVEKVDVSAETNIFLDENFIEKHEEEREKFQEY